MCSGRRAEDAIYVELPRAPGAGPPPQRVSLAAPEDLEDAGNELMLADEEVVKYRVGGVFVHMDTSSAEERIEAGTEALEGEVGAEEEELAKIQAEMGDMKKVLYGRFGDAINLEE